MKAPFAYYGGKTGLAPKIVELFPAHKVYIEPFFGSGAVFFSKPRVPVEIINDSHHAVATFFRVLRDHREDLEEACALSPHSRTEFKASDVHEPVGDVEVARRFWVRVNQSFGKTAGNTGFSVTTARNQSIPGSVRSRLGRFEACAERLMGATIESCDAAGLVERLATPESVVYADPPYLGAVRKMRDDSAGDYAVDMPSVADHERLAEALNATDAAVVLSGYQSDAYDSLYSGWERVEFDVPVASSNAVTKARGARVEVLWMNFEPHVGQLFSSGA